MSILWVLVVAAGCVVLVASAAFGAWTALRKQRRQRRIDAAVALHRAGDHVGAETAFGELLTEAQRRGDRNSERFSLVNLAATLIAQQRQAEAQPLLMRAAELAQELGQPRGAAAALYNLAWTAFYGQDFDSAARLLSGARTAAGTQPPFDLGLMLALMDGRLATRQGLFEVARQALADAASRAPSAADKDMANQVEMAQGVLEYRAGNRAGLDLVLAGAQKVVSADRQDLAARWLTGLAYLAEQSADQDAARRLEAAAGALQRAPNFPSPGQCATYLRA
jgi:tetratricopeptide (TPR) repeat protein